MTKFCPECGAKQRYDNNRYCPNCGFDLSGLEEDSNLNSSGLEKDSNLNLSDSSTKSSSDSSTKRTKNYHSYSSKNDLFSNLSFNKCFLAFAILLILLTIGGMLLQADTEPYSDHGLTSFMDKSDGYDFDSFLEDYNNYDDSDYDSDYLSYAAYDVSTILNY